MTSGPQCTVAAVGMAGGFDARSPRKRHCRRQRRDRQGAWAQPEKHPGGRVPEEHIVICMWNDVSVQAPEPGWELLPENGWFALLGWAAGASNLCRAPASDEGRTVRVTLIERGVEHNYLEPFNPEDRAGVEASINGYLAEARVPARPAGYDWYLRAPLTWAPASSVLDELDSRIIRLQSQRAPSPAQILQTMELAVGGFYA